MRTSMSALELQRAITLIKSGYSVYGTALLLERDPRDVRYGLAAAGIQVRAIRQEVYSCTETAKLLGTTEEVVRGLIRAGLLHAVQTCDPVLYQVAHNTKKRKRFNYSITRRELRGLVVKRLAWAWLEPKAIVDPELRDLAVRGQEAAGGRWYTAGEIAQWACLTRSGALSRLRRGWLREWPQTVANKAKLVWVPNHTTLPPWRGR
jgi:hypothetical protein